MTDRLSELEREVRDLARTLASLSSRVASLEEAAALPPRPAPPAEVRAAAPGSPAPVPPAGERLRAGEPGGLLALAGRSFLALAGAFLIRAVTEAGAVNPLAGQTAGILYALTGLFLADRDGRRGRRASAQFHAVTAVLIAYPLLWEAATRFHVMGAVGAVGAVGAFTAIALWAASRQPSATLAWAATLGASATLLALLMETAAILPVAGAMLLLSTACVWLAYARKWPGPRWPAALGADFVVALLAAIASRPGGPPDAYRGLSIPATLLLCLALPILSIASFSIRTLARRREVSAFEAMQAVLSLAIGFGGAVAVARAGGYGVAALAAAAAAAGLGCYAVAFGFVARRDASAPNFLFYSSLAAALTLAGSALALSGPALAGLWALLGVAAAHLGGRYQRMSLRYHSALYCAAGAAGSGLARAGADAFFGASGAAWTPAGPAALVALAGAIGSYVALAAARRPAPVVWRRRVPAVVLASVGLAGLGTLAVRAFGPGGSAPFAGRAAGLAAVRTAVVATSAVALALASRLWRLSELRVFVYPLLLLGGVKLLLEDLPAGSPASLFLAFVFYGGALLLAPRLVRRPGAS